MQLWASANWHWHLKTEISPMEGKRRFRGVAWHPKNPLDIMLSTDGAPCYIFLFVCVGSLPVCGTDVVVRQTFA